MRTDTPAVRSIFAIILVGALLAPATGGVPTAVKLGACACPPAACMCPGHEHRSARAPACGMAHGGSCGLESSDTRAADFDLSLILFVPETRVLTPPQLSFIASRVSQGHQLAGYGKPDDPPPRPPARIPLS